MLNIKDPEALKLARAVAKETGESITRAVTVALRERLERLRHRRRPEAMAEELLSIGRRCAAKLKGKPLDYADMLYDERGLPR